MSVDGAGERDAGNRGDGCGLRGAASLAIAAWRRRRVPNLLAGIQTQREHAAALIRIDIGAEAVRDHDAAEIREGDIDVGAVRGRPPLHPTVGAALTDAHAPEHFALIIGIDGMYAARLLPRHQSAMPVR